jgi:HEAT repeat protein
LTAFGDPLANRIILGFVYDPEEDIRMAAAEKLQWFRDKSTLEQVVRLIETKLFYKKSALEQSTIFNYIARTKTAEALGALQKALHKSSLFSKTKYEVTQLCAVQALKILATPESREALRKGAKSSNKNVADACRKALEKSPLEVVA